MWKCLGAFSVEQRGGGVALSNCPQFLYFAVLCFGWLQDNKWKYLNRFGHGRIFSPRNTTMTSYLPECVLWFENEIWIFWTTKWSPGGERWPPWAREGARTSATPALSTTAPSSSWAARGRESRSKKSNKIKIYKSFTEQVMDSGEIYNAANDSWSPTPTRLCRGKRGLSLAVVGGVVFGVTLSSFTCIFSHYLVLCIYNLFAHDYQGCYLKDYIFF